MYQACHSRSRSCSLVSYMAMVCGELSARLQTSSCDRQHRVDRQFRMSASSALPGSSKAIGYCSSCYQYNCLFNGNTIACRKFGLADFEQVGSASVGTIHIQWSIIKSLS